MHHRFCADIFLARQNTDFAS